MLNQPRAPRRAETSLLLSGNQNSSVRVDDPEVLCPRVQAGDVEPLTGPRDMNFGGIVVGNFTRAMSYNLDRFPHFAGTLLVRSFGCLLCGCFCCSRRGGFAFNGLWYPW